VISCRVTRTNAACERATVPNWRQKSLTQISKRNSPYLAARWNQIASEIEGLPIPRLRGSKLHAE
jgi:hypothetical protein